MSIVLPKEKRQEKQLDNDTSTTDLEGLKGEVSLSGTTKLESLYCVLSEKQKILALCTCSIVTFLGPMSASIYLPALGSMASDLQVSIPKINLTITCYKIFQSVSPLFSAGFSDQNGRRPVVIACLLLFFGGSIGLALQTEFSALMVLRCFQGFASSSAMVVSGAAINDLVTRAERGKYMFYTTLGLSIGPSLGPVLGGILTEYLGWRSVFWFLAIGSGTVVCIMLLFLRETSRAVVGNGSLEPQSWNKCALEIIKPRKHTPEPDTRIVFKKRLGIRQTLMMLLDLHLALLALCSAASIFSTTAVLNSLTTLLARDYGLSPLHIGLCYLPFSVGGLTVRWTAGTLADRLFKYQARLIGEDIQPNRQSPGQLNRMPLEKARLGLTIPFYYTGIFCSIVYWWLMSYKVHLAAPLVVMFFFGNASTGAANTISMLSVDLNASRPASTRAAMNCVNHLVSAASVAAVVPLIDGIGVGWTGVFFAGIMLVSSPALWALYYWGHGWRTKKFPEDEDSS